MNYILEINAFERRMRRQPLPTAAQLLWYKLMAFANRQHWPEWFTVDNERLTEILGANSDKTVRTARQQLIDSGLLIYKKGVKGSPGRYKLTSISVEEFLESEADKDRTIYPAYDKPGLEGYLECDFTLRYGYTEALGAEVEKITQELLDIFKPGERANRKDVAEVFGKIIDEEGVSPNISLSISEKKKELLVYAFERASAAGSVNWRYVNGIYRKLFDRGIKTAADAIEYDLTRDDLLGR